MNVASVNLNLLVALEALLDERSVTRAAKRVGVTQPAMSNTLAQLRSLFDDPLFRRTSAGLEPTPRALAVAEPIRSGLRSLRSALAAPGFDPRSSTRTFVVAASDYVELVLWPPLLGVLAREAPSVTLEVRPWGRHEVPPMLARGEADLMIGYFDDVPPRHASQRLFREEYVCIVRKKHPRASAKLTMAKYLELGHVLVSQVGGSVGSVDRALAAQGKSRRIAARVSHFLMVPTLVARTDLVAALSRRVAEAFAGPLKLQVMKPPLELPTSIVGQAWHEQMETDPGHRWLRSVIARVASTL